MKSFVETYFDETVFIADTIDTNKIEEIVDLIIKVRDSGGRIFILGIGGSAGNASHMVNDLRKLCGIECYAPTDNVSELTARTNDEGFETVFEEYLRVSHFTYRDGIFVLSVGGGNKKRNISTNLINGMDYASQQGGEILGIVGRSDGYAAQHKGVLVIPCPSPERITPHSESFQAVVWHCIVSHPKLQINATKW